MHGATPQELRAALAYGLSEWLSDETNQEALAATGVELSQPEVKGVIQILRGEVERRVIDREYFGQDRKTVDGVPDRAARGIAQALVMAEPDRFDRMSARGFGDRPTITDAARLPVSLAPRPLLLAGREELLAELDYTLAGGPTPRVTVLSGMGGVGKTSTAVEYAHRHLGELSVAWQVQAED